MRQARIRPEDTDTFMHVFNRVTGPVGDYPFGRPEKERFINLMRDLTRLFTIEVIAYELMGNHFHILCHIPGTCLSQEDAVARFNRYYEGKRVIEPNSPKAEALPAKLRDISAYMHALEQGFSRWYNRTRTPRRRGYLWGNRFKNTILQSGLSVWHCWQYIELNCVRARLAVRPDEYRFGSFGTWLGTGGHPFADSVAKHVLPSLPPELGIHSLDELLLALRRNLAIGAAEALKQPIPTVAAAGRAVEKERFSTRVDRRVRYWVDGLVIGSDIFVKTVVAKARGDVAVNKRRLIRAFGVDEDAKATAPPILYSFKQLRRLV
jgi:putative transposase